MKKPVVLCILDGWGYRLETEANAVALAETPNFDRIWATCPHATLAAHGPDVGLPDGQMGNSEVGHMNIGAGRVVCDGPAADRPAIEDGSFATNPRLAGLRSAALEAVGRHRASGGARLARRRARATSAISRPPRRRSPRPACRVAVHAFLDGRDMPPRSAERADRGAGGGVAARARGSPRSRGRYYAMDRDKRWDRVERGLRPRSCTARALRAATRRPRRSPPPTPAARPTSSSPPTVIGGYAGARDGDGLLSR